MRTILKRLEGKGYVKHRVDGRPNVYTGVDAPRNVAAKVAIQIIEDFCGRLPEQLLVGTVAHAVEEDELQRLAKQIGSARSAR